MKRKTVYIIFMLLTSLMGYSQQNIPWDELQKINNVFLTADSYVIKSNYSMYKGTASTPIESFSGIVKKSKQNTYYKLGQTEIFVKGKKQFFIKHDDKYAVINNQYIEDNEYNSPQAVTGKLELLKKTNANIKYSIIDNSTGVFKCYTKSNKPILELYYNKLNYYIKQIVIFKDYYDNDDKGKRIAENYKLVINYESIALSAQNISDSDFSFDKYISEEKGVFKLKPAYSNYKLIAY